LINFHKRALISQVIREIQQYQQAPYCLEAVPLIQEWLINAEYLSEDECYRESLKIETKQNRQRAPSDSLVATNPSTASTRLVLVCVARACMCGRERMELAHTNWGCELLGSPAKPRSASALPPKSRIGAERLSQKDDSVQPSSPAPPPPLRRGVVWFS
jgi:hypothetical protein